MSEASGGLVLEDFVGATLRICLGPRRVLKGVLVAVDCHANYLLDKVVEHNEEMVRELGLVSVPSKSVVSVKMDSSQFNKIRDERISIKGKMVKDT
ncbi:Mak31p Ecym_1350 [Eremothecium cymbalariae DBVPG|uniref:Sm domain-containing protein n=1 Tax=Eremothecium cymbalariae (strain CBS 270.75 / DBVPG 7215 / KCTC 17166 / NRRL Y-17582) TaxID=931890 RepID=G8JNC0_ERECY|nr:hypothetical protein Ecym_1350 [Eremothecium cymbalariae DBVPG\